MRPLLIAAFALLPFTALSQTVTHGLGVGQTPVSNGMKRLDTGNDSRGWEAVGRLELAGKGFCTAAMIEPHLVLTAAHCLWDKVTGLTLDTEEIEFRAGWRNGRAVAYRKIRRAVAHPDYIFTGAENLGQVPHDLALLELASPIRLPTIRPYPIGEMPRRGDEVGIVSYARLRAEAPSLQSGCKVLSSQAGVAVMSCDVDFGSSGSPVFRFIDGRPEMVSVVTAKAEMNGEKVSLGMDMRSALPLLQAEISKRGLARTTGKLPQVSESQRGLLGNSNGVTSGAKFVRSRPSPDPLVETAPAAATEIAPSTAPNPGAAPPLAAPKP